MTKVEINGKLEFIESPEQFADQIEQYMGREAKEYFNDLILIKPEFDKDMINETISKLKEAQDYLEEIKAECEE